MPPIQRVVDKPAVTLHPDEFRQDLTTHNRPRPFVRPLEHSISVDGGGRITGIAKPVAQRESKPAASRALTVTAGIRRFVQRVTFGPQETSPADEAIGSERPGPEVEEPVSESAVPVVAQTITADGGNSDVQDKATSPAPGTPRAAPDAPILADRPSPHNVAPVQRAKNPSAERTSDTPHRTETPAGDDKPPLVAKRVDEPQEPPVAQRAVEEHLDQPAEEPISSPTLDRESPAITRDLTSANAATTERTDVLPTAVPRRLGLGPPLPTTLDASFAQRSVDAHEPTTPTPPPADPIGLEPATGRVEEPDAPEPPSEPSGARIVLPLRAVAPIPADSTLRTTPTTPVLGGDALTTTVQRSITTPLATPSSEPSPAQQPRTGRQPSADESAITIGAPEATRRAPHSLPIAQRQALPTFERTTATAMHALTEGAPAPRIDFTEPGFNAAPSSTPTITTVQRASDESAASPLTAQAAEESPSGTAESNVGPMATGGGASGASLPSKPGELDELARRLYGRIRTRLKTELRLDRERSGRVTDLSR